MDRSAAANVRRNSLSTADRATRWRTARDGAWRFLDEQVTEGATIAIVGAGNCDDLPLTRLATRCRRVDLLDIDPDAPRRAIRREGRSLRRRLRVLAGDATAGHARDVLAAVAGGTSQQPAPLARALGEPPYDLVVGDLFYSQLLYPALRDAGLSGSDIDAVLLRHGDAVTATAVAALHATAPRVIHFHDPIAWWEGHSQPFTLAELLARQSLEAAEDLIATGNRPIGCDPLVAEARRGRYPTRTAYWRWPFTSSVDYVIRGTSMAAL